MPIDLRFKGSDSTTVISRNIYMLSPIYSARTILELQTAILNNKEIGYG
jgi:hypothetical protein